MPAKSLQRVSGESTYSLVYNKGVENRIIFNDTQDYDVFIKYLKEYLSAPIDHESAKQSFTINGRTYKGTPHQPKNYLNEVELIAYRLLPDHFYLILHQVTSNAQTRFLRSLLTRYSIYFNKKYKHTGPLFDGPYKSTPINNLSKLAEAAAEIHALKTEDKQAEIYSSYYEYAGKRTTSWLKPAIEQNPVSIKIEPPVPSEVSKSIPVSPKHNSNAKRIQFFASSFTIFVLLFAIGLMNVNISSITAKSTTVAVLIPTPSPINKPLTPVASPVTTPMVAAAQDENPPPKMEIVINIGKDLKSVNLRESATTSSDLVGTAVNGDTFEYVSETPGWYKIMLEDGSAYVSTKYAQKKGEVTN